MLSQTRFNLLSLLLVMGLLLVVTPVLAQDSESTIEFSGTINAIDGMVLTVDGLMVDVSAAETSLTLEVDMVVKVEGTLLDDGTVAASEVSAVEADDSSNDDTDVDTLELVGPLDSLGDSTAVVGGMEFDITGATIEAGLEVGDLVKVHASLSDDGSSWLASSIKRYDDTDETTDDSDDDVNDDSNDGDDDGDDSNDDSNDSSACTFEVESSSANVRSGPGTGNDIVGFAYEDDVFPVLEIDSTGTWIMIDEGQWIAVSTGELKGDCSILPVSNEPINSDDSSGNDDSDDHSSDQSDDGSDDHDGDDSDDSSDDHNDDDHSDDHNDDSSDDHNDDDHSNDDDDDHSDDS